MAGRAANAERLCAKGIIAVVRASSSEQLIDVAEALCAGGVDCIEITMTTPDALAVIRRCREVMADRALIGVGSVLSVDAAGSAIAAGAQYVVSPVFKVEIIAAAHQADVPCIPGAFTPTEVLLATDAGADIVKVFPAGQLGPRYLKDLLAPMPHLRLMPTGGVNLETAAAWIAAGAVTLAVGSALVTKAALAAGELGEIERLAGRYVEIVAEARASKRTA